MLTGFRTVVQHSHRTLVLAAAAAVFAVGLDAAGVAAAAPADPTVASAFGTTISTNTIGGTATPVSSATPDVSCIHSPDTFGGANANSNDFTTDGCGHVEVEPFNYYSRWHGWYYVPAEGWREGAAGDQGANPDTWTNPLITNLASGVTIHVQECAQCTAGVQTDEISH